MLPRDSYLLQYPRKLRSRLRPSLYLGMLLHYMYLSVKNCQEESRNFDSVEELIKSEKIAEKIQKKEGSPLKYDAYLQAYFEILNRGYSSLLDATDVLWRISVSKCRRKFDIIREIISADNLQMGKLINRDYIRCYDGFNIKINNISVLVLETELEHLSRTLMYLGAFDGYKLNLDLAVASSLKKPDAEALINAQRQGMSLKLNRPFKFYFPLYRIQRTAYRKIEAKRGNLMENLKMMLSSRLLTPRDVERIVSGEARANLFCATPVVSLGGGICLIVAFKGLLKTLPHFTTQSVLVSESDIVFKLLPGYYTVFDSAGVPEKEYVFLVAVPLTLPRVGILLGMWSADEIGEIKPAKRGAQKFDRRFPKIEEITQRV